MSVFSMPKEVDRKLTQRRLCIRAAPNSVATAASIVSTMLLTWAWIIYSGSQEIVSKNRTSFKTIDSTPGFSPVAGAGRIVFMFDSWNSRTYLLAAIFIIHSIVSFSGSL